MSPNSLSFGAWRERYFQERKPDVPLLSDESGVECVEGMMFTATWQEELKELWRIISDLELLPISHPCCLRASWASFAPPKPEGL